MANYDLQKLFENVEQFVNSEQGKQILSTGQTTIEKQGDANYLKAALIAQSLFKITGARPVINDMGNSTYVVTWAGEEQNKATEYFKSVVIKSFDPNKPVEPVSVDFAPVLSPLGIRYGAPVLIGGALVAFGLGWSMRGKK
jgi:hypothetical protein